MRLSEKVALITGAASGIGRAATQRFAAEGASVVAVDVDEDGLAETAALVTEAGGTVSTTRADVALSDDCAAMVAHAEATFGCLDVLFNNAGVMLAGDDDAVSTDESVWD